MADYVVETSGLTRRFGRLTAVEDLALAVPRGAVYGFLGPNGAGKSTTLRLLLGLIRPDAGEGRLFGDRLFGDRRSPGGRSQARRRDLLRRVGALVESPSLYPNLTGRENLEVTRRLKGLTRSHIGYALHLVGMEGAADRLVRGYSTGMKQRLGLALALLGMPELLILDEPTNGLDPAGMQEMRALIRRLPEELGVTVLLSSHLLAEVEQVATHIGIIQEGRLVFQGTQDELRAQMEGQAILQVDHPDRAREVLTNAGWTARSNGSPRLAVAVSSPSDTAMVNALLVRNGINVYHLGLDQPTLEDVFLTLTRRSEAYA